MLDAFEEVADNSARRIGMASVKSIGNNRYCEVGRDLTVQIGGNATTAIGVANVQLGATGGMQAFDDGPLKLAYGASKRRRCQG